jgi:hypothetical protein
MIGREQTAFLGWIAAAIVWAVFSIWTIQRVWLPSTCDRYSRLVHGYGVKRWGIATWLAVSLVGPAILPPGWRGLLDYLKEAIFVLFLGLPLWLWGGYFWGAMMAKFLGSDQK